MRAGICSNAAKTGMSMENHLVPPRHYVKIEIYWSLWLGGVCVLHIDATILLL